MIGHCTKSNIDDCPTKPLDVVVPASSQELDPSNLDANGNVLKEAVGDYQLWAVVHDNRGEPRGRHSRSTRGDCGCLYPPRLPLCRLLSAQNDLR